MSQPPHIVVFDIGNVLVRWDMRNLFEKVIADRAELDAFLANVCTMQWHGTLDGGASFAHAIKELSARFPQYAQTIALYDPRWQETIAGAIEGSVAILERLRRAGVPTYAITNFPAEKFDETCALYPFLKGFDGVIVSGRERVTKPDPAIFRLFLDRFGLQAPRVRLHRRQRGQRRRRPVGRHDGLALPDARKARRGPAGAGLSRLMSIAGGGAPG